MGGELLYTSAVFCILIYGIWYLYVPKLCGLGFLQRAREYVRERDTESYRSEVDNDLVLIFGFCPMRKQDLIEKVCGHPVKAAIGCKGGKMV